MPADNETIKIIEQNYGPNLAQIAAERDDIDMRYGGKGRIVAQISLLPQQGRNLLRTYDLTNYDDLAGFWSLVTGIKVDPEYRAGTIGEMPSHLRRERVPVAVLATIYGNKSTKQAWGYERDGGKPSVDIVTGKISSIQGVDSTSHNLEMCLQIMEQSMERRDLPVEAFIYNGQ